MGGSHFFRCWGFVLLFWGKVVGGLFPDGSLPTPTHPLSLQERHPGLGRGGGATEARPSQVKMPKVLLQVSPRSPRHLPMVCRSPQTSKGGGVSCNPCFRAQGPHCWSTMLWGLPRLPVPFIPLTWGPKPISALWQWGCSSRPVQKTHTPPLTPPNSCPGVDGPNLDMDRTGRRYRVPVLKSPKGMHLPKLLPICKTRRMGHPRACGPHVPGLPKSPLVLHVTRGTNSSRAPQDCPLFTLTICFPGSPAVPREIGIVGHPTCHPGLGLLRSWFPYLYSLLPTL